MLSIDEIGLSVRSKNALHQANVHTVGEMLKCSEEDLNNIRNLGKKSIGEILEKIKEYKGTDEESVNELEEKSFNEIIYSDKYRDAILQYVKANDVEIVQMDFKRRSKNGLLSNGYSLISDIIFMTRSDLKKIPAIGAGSVEEIAGKIEAYLEKNQARIMAVLSGDESALWDDEAMKQLILKLYEEIGFGGLSLDEIITKLKLPDSVTRESVKRNIGSLIANKELEYVDFRCYRVYGRFEDYLAACPTIDERNKEFISKRLQGYTLEAIANENGLTRQRIRQIVKDNIKKVGEYHFAQTGMKLFDEDYYRYLYATYAFEKKDGTDWLGVPAYVWNYLDLMDVERGENDLQSALEDYRGLDVGLRLKIKNYLNRNKLYIDGMWIEKKRADLEQVVVRKFCQDDVSFDDFCRLYNSFLEEEEIPYDDSIYYTDGILRSRINHLMDVRFLLWKQSEKIRYYDVDGKDYTELLDVLNLDSYENIELSTVKFMRDYPEIMKKYDIRDQYELHNLLRKIIPEGSYHNFRCGRTPGIIFGEFNRDEAIFDILRDNSPISMTDLAELVSEEYGYDTAVIIGTYLKDFSKYYHQGMYSIDQKQMSTENMSILKKALTEDFYYIDEIRQIYQRLIPNADIEEINSFNLITMGFVVRARYAFQNYATMDAYFNDLFTKEEIIDLAPYRKRFVYLQIFSQKLMELKRNLEVVEFEPNKIISFKKLEQACITRERIQEYCDAVYDFVSDGEYFSVKSLKSCGFNTELFDLGYSDWFYANLLISDDRFSFGMMFGNLILYKGKANITIKSFEMNLIRGYKCVDVADLLHEMTDKYGCKISDRAELLYKVQNTEIYYDKVLEKFYANIDLYYEEMEDGGME